MPTNSLANYGTIPASSPPPSTSNFSFFSVIPEKAKSLISTSRPWQEFADPMAFSPPHNYPEAMTRIQKNANHFGANYALLVLFMLLLSLLWHPVSIIMLLILVAGWLALYFLRDGPVVVFGWVLRDGVVLIGLSLLTIMVLGFNRVFGSIIIGMVMNGLHGAFRVTDDLYVDQGEGVDGRLISVEGMTMKTGYGPI